VKYVCIKKHRGRFPVTMMCRLLGVSTSGFYAWRSRSASEKEKRSRRLLVKIRAIFKRCRRAYGSPRIWRELVAGGEIVGLGQVARLMREDGLRAKQARKFKNTTDSNHKMPVAPNILGAMAPVSRENEVWVTDITYLWTRMGWLYLAAVMDLHSRRIVGWATSSRMKTDLISQALERALALRGPVPGLVLHSDRGSQYASKTYQKRLKAAGLICSMSRKGNCYDNAAMESFWHSLKVEWLYDFDFATRREAVCEIEDYIDGFYNRERSHSSLGYISPIEFEAMAKLEKCA
jgi:putative transposase